LQVVGTSLAVSVGFFFGGAALSISSAQRTHFLDALPPERAAVLEMIERAKIADGFRPDNDACQFGASLPFDTEMSARFAACGERHGGAVVVFGDSHSADVYAALARVDAYPFLLHLDQGQCRPHLANSSCEDSPLLNFFSDNYDKIKSALYIQAGFYLFRGSDGRPGSRSIFLGEGDRSAKIDALSIVRVAEFLDRIWQKTPVVWVGPRFEPHVPMDSLLSFDCDRASEALEVDQRDLYLFSELDNALFHTSDQYGFSYISAMKAIKFDIQSDLLNCEELFWSDGDHWSPEGEVRFGARLKPLLLEQLGRVDGNGRGIPMDPPPSSE
jgi:hypothetical protein